LSIRTSDDREVGTLLGFVIDPERRRLSGLVMEVATGDGSQQVASSLVPLRLDAGAYALVLVDSEIPRLRAYEPDSLAAVDDEDLWVPLIHTAA
jgi:hypothetical protein